MQDGTILKVTFWIFLSIAFFIIITLPPQSEQNQEKMKGVGVKNQSMTKNIPNGIYTKSYSWGWSDDYCLRNLKLKDGSIIRLPRCEF